MSENKLIEFYSQEITEKILEKYSSNAVMQFIRLGKMIYSLTNDKITNNLDIEKKINEFYDLMDKYSLSSQVTYYGYLQCLYKVINKPIPKSIQDKIESTGKSNKKKVKNNKHEELVEYDNDDIFLFQHQKVKTDGRRLSRWLKLLSIAFLKEIPCRFQEICDLEWCDNDDSSNNYVDLDKKKMYIRNHKTSARTNKKYVYKLSDEIIDILQRYKKKFNYKYIFLSNRKPYNDKCTVFSLSTQFTSMIKSYCKDRNIKYVKYGIHDIRHSYATNNIKDIGITIEQIEKLKKVSKELKHKSLDTTITHYLKTIKNDKTEVKNDPLNNSDILKTKIELYKERLDERDDTIVELRDRLNYYQSICKCHGIE